MADKHKSLVSVFLEFVAGERPTADKFNALVTQTKRAFFNLETAVGDIHDESWPYAGGAGNPNSTRLTVPWGTRHGTSDSVVGAADTGRPLNIANIARLIGPASNLNPRAVSDFPLIPTSHQIAAEPVTTDVREYDFRYPVAISAVATGPTPDIVFAEPAPPSCFLIAVPTLAQVTSSGHYYFSPAENKVYTWDRIPQFSTVSYPVRAVEFGGGPNYALARFNTIPDQNQVLRGGVDGTLEILNNGVPDARGLYGFRFPFIVAQQSNIKQDNASLSAADDLNYGERYYLPYYFEQANFTPGDIIPQGLVYLRCEDTGQNFTEAEYFYSNQHTIYVGNIELPTGFLNFSWSLVTVGTDITTSIDDIRQKAFTHSHDRTYGEPAISITDLTDNFKDIAFSGRFFPSAIASNYFPQYLHRDGYRHQIDTTGPLASDFTIMQPQGEHTANDKNAFRGHLVIGRRTTGTTPDEELTQDNYIQEGGYLAPKGESFYLSFGDLPHNIGNGTGLNPRAPQIWRTKGGSAGHFRIESQQGGSIALFAGDEIRIDARSFITGANSRAQIVIEAESFINARSQDLHFISVDSNPVLYPNNPTPPNNKGISIDVEDGSIGIYANAIDKELYPTFNSAYTSNLAASHRGTGADSRGILTLGASSRVVAQHGMQLGNPAMSKSYYTAAEYTSPPTKTRSAATHTVGYGGGATFHTSNAPAWHSNYWTDIQSTGSMGMGDGLVRPQLESMYTSHSCLAFGMNEHCFRAQEEGLPTGMWESHWVDGPIDDRSPYVQYWVANIPCPDFLQTNDRPIEILGYNLMVRRDASKDWDMKAFMYQDGAEHQHDYPASPFFQGALGGGEQGGMNTVGSGTTGLRHVHVLSEYIPPLMNSAGGAFSNDDLTNTKYGWDNHHPQFWNKNSIRLMLNAGGPGPTWHDASDPNSPHHIRHNDPEFNASDPYLPPDHFAADRNPINSLEANPFSRNYGHAHFNKVSGGGDNELQGLPIGDQNNRQPNDPGKAYCYWLPITVRIIFWYTTR